MNDLSGVLCLYVPCGAGAVAVTFPSAMRVSAVMRLVVSRHAMSGCLCLHRARLQVALMT